MMICDASRNHPWATISTMDDAYVNWMSNDPQVSHRLKPQAVSTTAGGLFCWTHLDEVGHPHKYNSIITRVFFGFKPIYLKSLTQSNFGDKKYSAVAIAVFFKPRCSPHFLRLQGPSDQRYPDCPGRRQVGFTMIDIWYVYITHPLPHCNTQKRIEKGRPSMYIIFMFGTPYHQSEARTSTGVLISKWRLSPPHAPTHTMRFL